MNFSIAVQMLIINIGIRTTRLAVSRIFPERKKTRSVGSQVRIDLTAVLNCDFKTVFLPELIAVGIIFLHISIVGNSCPEILPDHIYLIIVYNIGSDLFIQLAGKRNSIILPESCSIGSNYLSVDIEIAGSKIAPDDQQSVRNKYSFGISLIQRSITDNKSAIWPARSSISVFIDKLHIDILIIKSSAFPDIIIFNQIKQFIISIAVHNDFTGCIPLNFPIDDLLSVNPESIISTKIMPADIIFICSA